MTKFAVTEIDLDAIRSRCEAATPGPWERGDLYLCAAIESEERCMLCDGRTGDPVATRRMVINGKTTDAHIHRDREPGGGAHRIESSATIGPVCGNYEVGSGGVVNPADTNFIAHAREDLPALLAEVKILRSQMEFLLPRVGEVWHWQPMDSRASTRLIVLGLEIDPYDGDVWVRSGQPHRLSRDIMEGTETLNELGTWIESCVLVEPVGGAVR